MKEEQHCAPTPGTTDTTAPEDNVFLTLKDHMGRPIRVSFAREDAERYRQVVRNRQAKVRWLRKRLSEVLAVLGSEPDADAIPPVVERINDLLYKYSSNDRLPVLLELTEGAPASVFWPVMFKAWTSCDDTWALRNRLLSALRHHAGKHSPIEFFSVDQHAAYSSLPLKCEVFRGCSRERVAGISWALDEEVARGFARGHRGIAPFAPVVVTATIRTEHIFGPILDRTESEVLLDPSRLTRLAPTQHI